VTTYNQPLDLILDELVIGYTAPLRDPVSVRVDPGHILGILGPSGCGKSTLLSTIAGIVPALGGDVFLGDARITDLRIDERRVGLVFQEPLLFDHLSVTDNVSYGLRRQGVPRSQARARARELLAWIGLPDFGDRSITTLSGGQAQRIALARAVAPAPRALLLDEPFSALDAPLRRRLARETRDRIESLGVPAIHVTHDPEEAALICREILSW
jgi:thiamine transport system ATP-binding protein